MSLINISNLTFAYEGSYENVFENVSFQIDTNWKLGFTGRNGRGKTTFLNLLLGKYEYTGKITASVQFEYFPYEISNKSVTTIDAVEQICPEYQFWELLREMSLLDIDENILYRPFGTLSNGEQTKILLAALFLKENRFLLIDEPTNHLDILGRKLVSNYLNRKNGFILVSHDRSFLNGCIDHILSINKTDIDIQRGNFTSWLINKERQDQYEISEHKKLSKEAKSLERKAKEKAVWADKIEAEKFGKKVPDRGYIGHKSTKMMKRAKSIENRQKSAVEEKSKLLKNIENSESLKISQLSYHKSRIISFEDVSISYGNKLVCSDINFTAEQGDRIALQGKNGSGKSSILKLICGENIPYEGNVQIASHLSISYVSQDTGMLNGYLSNYAAESQIDESLFKAILRKLDFSREQFDKNMADFSGGQKKKVLIAKSLCEKAHIHIWDEPLNYIDILSRMQIEALIKQYHPTMLFVEHDQSFCDSIATKIIPL